MGAIKACAKKGPPGDKFSVKSKDSMMIQTGGRTLYWEKLWKRQALGSAAAHAEP